MNATDTELVYRARQFATTAHRQIDHRRRHTSQPYAVHLKSVAEIVSFPVEVCAMLALRQHGMAGPFQSPVNAQAIAGK